MLISATDIEKWASTPQAQSVLPVLIRRLIGSTATVTAIVMPAGSSVTVGGFDGELDAADGNAWVPKGKSVWELSVQGNPKVKADKDYIKRTSEVGASERKSITYVAITGRRWKKRHEWSRKKQALGEWKAVRAYDADDIETWLEQDTATQVWFAELLGIPVDAMRSPETYWQDWNRDVVPQISPEAVLASRTSECERLLTLLNERRQGGTIVLHADSSEEAVAFACAAIIQKANDASLKCVVVSNVSGWIAVSSGSGINVAIAAETIVASSVPNKQGLVLVVPVATGDSEAHFPGHRGLDIDPDICLQRTFPEAFRDALCEMGVDRGDAERLALQCGRSWSVYRRLKNRNPAQRQPTWASDKYAPVLTTIALVGAFLEENKADWDVVEAIADVPAADFQAQSKKLIMADDAPIVRVGNVIKAKSSLELFKLNEPGVSDAKFDRFLEACRAVLGQADPAFDMPKEDRWLANVQGKIRPQSGVLFRALADALPRIAVLASKGEWRWKIAQLVRSVTSGIDGKQWLAISGLLRQLAEAAPDEFLDALEADLSNDAPQVFALFEETSSAGVGGGCVYADLLWALESLAWAQNRLLRVARVLASLSAAPNESGWSNTPKASLLNIFRGWRPQTSASVDMRNQAISALAISHPDETFDLMMGMIHRGHDMASPSPRPNWRDDDSGVSETVSSEDYAKALTYAAETGFKLAGSSVENALNLFERYDVFDAFYRERVLGTVTSALDVADDTGIRKVRKALRYKLYWELNFGGKRGDGLPEKDVSAIRDIYEQSEPSDLIEKHQWLFENYYCELPEKEGRRASQEGQDRVRALRTAALQDIFDERGFAGIEALDDVSSPNGCVGASLRDLQVPENELFRWVASKFSDGDVPVFLGDWLRTFTDERMEEVLREFLRLGFEELSWTDQTALDFLCAARCDPTTWLIVAEYPAELQESYWTSLTHLPLWLKPEARRQGLARLLQYNNVAAALRSLKHNEEDVDGSEVAEILERNFSARENALGDLQHHDIRDLVEVMEKSEALDRQRLLMLEFQLVAAFGQFSAELMTELQRELVQNPAQMLFAISKAYKADGEQLRDLEPQEVRWAEVCRHLLFYTNLTPGIQRDGTFSDDKFQSYITELLRMASIEGYIKGTQIVVGELLAYAPATENGDWPPQCVCTVLDKPEHDTVRRTFQTGVYNKRGVTSRLPYDGGEQERELAVKFQGYADRCQIEFPLTAKTLSDIAARYQRDALRHDRDAEHSKDRY